ncbi:MAG: hypothetical protein E5V51_00240 [Mesorhizobium sp.]|nr:hypothetical protein EOA35_01115 [Mesorhizobium sp. M8A.F.Ca.ET.023.01.1.1]TIW90633.1 MAG: hypothetical protein E5V51_00240 [Mesorhizobium sp.]
MHGKLWRLFCDGVNHGATISQFQDDGPFYGTWEVGGGGRTGAMTTLEDCKRRVESEVMRRERPN